jgi:hypothetical protein
MLIALGIAVLSVLAVLPAARLPDQATGAVAAVFLPGTAASATYAAIAGAGGTPVRTALGGTVWIARSDAPGFAGRLRSAGAVTVLDPIVAAGCLSGPAAADSSFAAARRPDAMRPDQSRASET